MVVRGGLFALGGEGEEEASKLLMNGDEDDGDDGDGGDGGDDGDGGDGGDDDDGDDCRKRHVWGIWRRVDLFGENCSKGKSS